MDLAIDSDNNNGYDAPDRGEAEAATEDLPGHPGKLIRANSDDSDGDGIPDFADGFDWDGTAGNDDDASAGDAFVELLVEIPELIDVSAAEVTIAYAASDPAGVTSAGSEAGWAPAPGQLRIWKDVKHRHASSASAHRGNPRISE